MFACWKRQRVFFDFQDFRKGVKRTLSLLTILQNKIHQRYFYYVEGSLIIFFQTATTMIDFKSIGNQI